MQRTPSTPMMNNAPSTFATWSGGSSQPALQLSPPTLLPPYIAPDLELVYPSAPSSLASSTSSSVSQASSTQASLSPQVEQLSNLINDLSLFLPQADTLSSDQLQAFQAAVDTMLGKTPQPSVSTLGNAIQLRNDNANNVFADDMPTFYVGLPPSLHDAPGAHTNPTHALYDPSTPQDVDMLGNSTSKPSYSMSSLEKDVGGMELQVQHNPPPYEARIDFSMLDNDLDLVPPRW